MKDNNPKTQHGEAKPSMSLCPPVAMQAMARVMRNGADKYGPWNWRDQPISMSVYLDAIGRHWSAMCAGEDLDPDSGLSHLAHIMAGCGIIMDAVDQGCMTDDRPQTRAKPATLLVEMDNIMYATRKRDRV